MRPEPVRRPEMAATTYRAVEDAVIRVNLRIFGGFHPTEADNAPAGCRTLFMLGPDEPGFWDRVSLQPEFSDGKPDPLDRWSRRAVEPVAEEVGATALFPFGGPPWLPFFSWALRTGRCWQSPVRFLVHDTAGLFVSFRAALAFSREIDLPAANSASPCGIAPNGRACTPARPACLTGGATTPRGARRTCPAPRAATALKGVAMSADPVRSASPSVDRNANPVFINLPSSTSEPRCA